jgi:hypothetical protein
MMWLGNTVPYTTLLNPSREGTVPHENGKKIGKKRKQNLLKRKQRTGFTDL